MLEALASPPPDATAEFPRREVDLGLSTADVPRDWYAGDRFLTAFWEALSLLFPRGETFFVESVRHFRDRIDDPALVAAAAAFVGQEAMHGKEHRALNKRLAERYPAVPRLDAELAWLLATARRVLGPEGQLAATCALEHLTAILAEQLMAVDRHAEATHPSVRALWLWHALEESEHKAVAFDVYRAIGGGEARRLAVMALATVVFLLEVGNVYLRLLATDRSVWSVRGWLRTVGFFWLKPGLLRRQIPAYLAYFRPGFHPSERDADDLVQRTRARLFGPGGPLAGRTREVW